LRSVHPAPHNEREILHPSHRTGTQQTLMEREIGPEAKEAIVTVGQQLREEGRQEYGCAVLLRLLRRRFGNEVDASVERRVATASLGQIEIWTERVLSAATLTELLAD
jgi:hypothetical protein